MPHVTTAIVWALAAMGPGATTQSAPTADPKAVSPHCATLLEAGPWFPFPSRAAGADWTQDLRELCSTDRKSEEQRLDEVYGVGEYAGHLFECIRHAAAIIPRFTDLVCEPSDRYMPQMGLLLVDYVELPTRFASQEQERTGVVATAPSDQRSIPASAPQSQPATVVGIRDFANGRLTSGSATPDTIAVELRQHVNACRSRLPGLRHMNPLDSVKAQRLGLLLDRIELTAHLGEHFAHKIQAAVAWERYRKGDTNEEIECTRRLRESLDDWARVVTAADRVSSQSILCWQPRMVTAPPWSLQAYQTAYVTARGHWREQQRRFERELDLISESIRQKRNSATLPLWDRANETPKQHLDPVAAFGFNLSPDNRYSLMDGATITTDQRLALTAGRSVLIDTRVLGPGEHVVFRTEPNHATMLAYRSYQISLLYRVVDRGGRDNEPFEIGVMGPDGRPVLGELRRWGAPDNHIDSRVITVPQLDRDDFSFFIKIHGSAAIVIDDLRISALKDE